MMNFENEMLNEEELEFDYEDYLERINEKEKHRKRRRNNRKYMKRHNQIKYVKSNREGLIDPKTGKRRYNTWKNKEIQHITNKKLRQHSSFVLEGGVYKKITTETPYIKNKYGERNCIWNKPEDIEAIPDLNITKNEYGEKIIDK